MSIVTVINEIDIGMTLLKPSEKSEETNFLSKKAFKYTSFTTMMGSIFETQNAEGRIMGRKIDGSYVYTCIMEYIATQNVEGNGRYLHL